MTLYRKSGHSAKESNIPMFVQWWYSLNRKGKRYHIFIRMEGQIFRCLFHRNKMV